MSALSRITARFALALNRGSVRRQLYLGFGGVLLLAGGLGAVALTALAQLDRQTDALADKTLAGVAVAYGLSRRLRQQLGGEPRTAVSVARAVADGDLCAPIPIRPGDSKSLLARLQGMQTQLAASVKELRLAAEGVAVACAQIARGNQDLSSRTEEQAGALQQTAGTMGELGDTVRDNAEAARQANQLAQGASAIAVRGGQVADEVVTTMRDINNRSKQIADITSVIDGIAFPPSKTPRPSSKAPPPPPACSVRPSSWCRRWPSSSWKAWRSRGRPQQPRPGPAAPTTGPGSTRRAVATQGSTAPDDRSGNGESASCAPPIMAACRSTPTPPILRSRRVTRVSTDASSSA